MKLGCHAVLFRERIKSETEEVIKGLAATGFQGIEIGARFFGTADKQFLLDLLAQYQVTLSGMHVGAPLPEWLDQEQELTKRVMNVGAFVQDLPDQNIIMSGSAIEGTADLKKIAQRIETVAQQCLQMGVRLNYHNHAWEFADQAAVFNALVEYAPSLQLGLDLGWVYVGGFDPVALVEKYRERISYVHLRDVGNGGREFVNLGEGVFNYAKLMNSLEQVLGKDGWAVVEYEEGPVDLNRYARAKAFLDRIIQ
jgi:inosose dehydratase